MNSELIIFVVMIATFIVGVMLFKLPSGISIVMAAIAGALTGGQGIPIRHLVEGTFSYVDTILVISCAMIFMKVVQKSGALDALTALIIEKFYKRPALLLCMVMFIIMFPGMITGSSTASVLSAGSIMAPVLLLMGIPAVEVASILALGGVLGMVAPPVNVAAMIIGGGIDIPYVGFEVPLALLTFPPAIVIVLALGHKYAKKMDYESIRAKLNFEPREKFGIKIYLPIMLVIVLLVLNRTVPSLPDLGMPLIFLISAFAGLFTGYKFDYLPEFKDAIKSVLPVLGILIGVGMFIQVMTLTGVRGFIVNTALSLPESMRYLAMAISIPLFGAISSYGSASVLGVPFLLAFMAKDQIITASAISLIAATGDMMPPIALAGMFASKVIGLETYTPVIKKCAIPVIGLILWALIFVAFANQLAPLIVFK